MKKYIVFIAILLSFIVSSYTFAIDAVKGMSLEEIQKTYMVVKYKDGIIEKRLISDFVEPKMKSVSMGLENSNEISNLEEAMQIAKKNDAIEFAEPLIIFRATDTSPNDINANDSWRFDITGINNLWDEFEQIDFSEITVAVIDTGVDIQNVDLNLDIDNDVDYVNDDDDADDDNGHGSHVAGVIGAIANNDIGMAGIASNVKILPLKVLNSSGTGFNDNVASAIRYAADNGVDIINMSLSSEAESSIVREAVEYASDLGVIIVAAVGNDSNHWANGETPDEVDLGYPQYANIMGYPAAFPEVLAIGSILYDNDEIYISDFSDTSGIRSIAGIDQEVFLDAVAPGSHIYSYVEDGSIYDMSGTSMASPHVAALAAIIKAKYNFLTNIQIREIINKTSSTDNIIIPSIDIYSGDIDSAEDIYGNGLISYNNAYGFDGLKALDIKAYDSEDNELLIENYTFDEFTYAYAFEVPENTDRIVFNGETMLVDSTIKLNDTFIGNLSNVQDFFQVSRKEYVFEITSEYSESSNEIIKTYTINITRANLSNDSDLSSLSVIDHALTPAFNSNALDYTLEDVSYETSSITVTAEKNDINADIQIKINDEDYFDYSSNTQQVINLTQSVDNVIKIKVIAQDLSTKEYSITVKRLSGNYLQDLEVKNNGNQDTITLNPEFNKTTFNYSKAVANAVDKIDVSYTIEDPLSIVKINDAIVSTKTIDLVEGENTVIIKVYSDGEENTNYKTYTLTITRAIPSNNSNLSSLSVIDHALSPTFDNNTLEYSLAAVNYETSSITISAVKNDINADIQMKINDEDYFDYLSSTQQVINLTQSVDNVIKIKVIAQDLSTKEYSITVKRLSGNYLQYLEVKDNVDQEIIMLNPEFNKTTFNYSKAVANEVDKIDVSYTVEDPSSIVKINDAIISTETIDLVEGENTVNIKVYSDGEENTNYKTYTLTITRLILSNDNNLSSLSVTGQNINPTFNKDTLSYTSTVNDNISSITVNAEMNDSSAELNINGTSYITISASKNISLAYGSNSVNIIVTAENGDIKTYNINVTRNSPSEPPPSPPPSGGGSSGGGGGGGGFIPPPSSEEDTEPEPESVPEDAITVVEDENGNVTMSIDVSEEKLNEALDDSTLDFVNIIAITDENTNEVQVNINENSLARIINSEKTVNIKFENVEFSLNSEIIKSLNLKGNLQIRSKLVNNRLLISKEKIKGKSISNVFELDIYDSDEKVKKVSEEIPIVLTYNNSSVKNSEKIAVFYFNDETNDWEYVGGKVIEDGKIIFKAKHFSKYAVREYEKTFDDIQNHWAKNDIEILASKKITNGVSENEFAPDRIITNSEFVVLLSRVLNLEETNEIFNFSDVPRNAWYIEELMSANSFNLLSGSYDDKFYPNDPIKRENMANILVNSYFYYTGLNESDIYITQEVKFNDEGSISQSLRNKVRISSGLGLILGDELSNFNPNNGATRAEASTVIKRLLKLLELM